MTVETEVKKVSALLPAVHARNFGLAEFKSRRWRAELTEEQTVEQAKEAAFWRHHVEQIVGHDKAAARGRGDIIEIYKPDTSEYVELLVVEIGSGFVKTRVISHSQPEVVPIPVDVPFATKWNVGRRAHDVVRKADGAVMAGGFQTKQSAVEWIKDHLNKLAA